MSCRDEFEELLFYVVELKDKLNAKLDEQCAKINQQATIVNQQGQIIDELCWQLRELSEKTRELRAENRVLRERVDAFGSGHCQCQEGEGGTYQNHVVERYNELVEGGGRGGRKSSKVKPVQGHEPKVVEYAQVDKVTPRRWPFGGGQKTSEIPEPEVNATTSGNTTWYLDVESIYEPIQLSAQPSTAAKLEQISAEVATVVPKPAPRRLYTTQAMENLAEYFGEIGSRSTVTLDESVADAVLLRRSSVEVEGRGGRFGVLEERQNSDSGKVVACSRLENLDKICLPSEEYLTADNLMRFTINSRPATTAPTATDKSTVDHRRHAIRSYI